MKILSVGYALPSKKVTNEDILREVDKNSGKYLSEKDLAKLKFKIAELLIFLYEELS